jgi:DNA-binding NtrC family response regulator
MVRPVLIISADAEHRQMLASITSSCGLRAVGCGTVEAAKGLQAREEFAAVLYELAEKDDYCAAIRRLVRCECGTPVIVVSTLDDWDSYLGVISAGAFDYVDFPPYPGELERLLCAVLSESGHENARTAAASRGLPYGG